MFEFFKADKLSGDTPATHKDKQRLIERVESFEPGTNSILIKAKDALLEALHLNSGFSLQRLHQQMCTAVSFYLARVGFGVWDDHTNARLGMGLYYGVESEVEDVLAEKEKAEKEAKEGKK